MNSFDNTRPIVLDVRRPDEFSRGHAANSLNIPLDELKNRLEEVRKLGQPVTVVCGGGTRALKGYELLRENGIACEYGKSWKDV